MLYAMPALDTADLRVLDELGGMRAELRAHLRTQPRWAGQLRRSLFAAASPDKPFVLMHLGAIDELLDSGRRALAEGAALVDAGEASGARGRLLAKRVRATVARAVEETLTRVGHALGPAPLALDEAHAKRVVDLELYVRQYHAEKDQASLGETLLRSDTPPW